MASISRTSGDKKPFTAMSGMVNFYAVAVPLGDHRIHSPWSDRSRWMGDYNASASYWHLMEAAFLLLTVVEDESLGGFLLRADEKTPDLFNAVIRAIASKGTLPYGAEEQARAALVRKYGYKTPYFCATISERIAAERAKIRKSRKDAAVKKGSRREAKQATIAHCRQTTMFMCGAVGIGDTALRDDDQHFGAGLDHDGRTEEEREALMEAIDAEGRAADDTRGVLPEELAAVAQGAQDSAKDVSLKWEVFAVEVKRKPVVDEGARVAMDLEMEGGEEFQGSRSAFHESMGPQYNGVAEEGGTAGMILCFAQFDPSINVGEGLRDIYNLTETRNKFEAAVNSGVRQFRRDGEYSRANDPNWHLKSYRDRNHPAFNGTRQTLAFTASANMFMQTDDKWFAQAIYGMQLTDREAAIHPDVWAQWKYAIKWMDRFGGDVSRLSPEDVFPGYVQRQLAGSSDPTRNELGYIDFKLPFTAGTRADPSKQIHRAWIWTCKSRAQVVKNGHGLMDQYFPWIEGVLDVTNVLGRKPSDSSAVTDDPLGVLGGGGGNRRSEIAASRVAVTEDWKASGAPYDTAGDTLQDYFWMTQKLWPQTLANWRDPAEDPEGYHNTWVPAMRVHEEQTEPIFREGMNPATSTNNQARAVVLFAEKLRRQTNTLSIPLYLHDCGLPLNEDDPYGARDPEHPGMDPFSHLKLKQVTLLRQVRGVEDPVLVLFALKATTTCFNFRPGKLCPLIVISAPAGEGKTFIIKVVMALSIEKTYRNENHLSNMGQTAANDVDISVLTDEGGGILQHRKFADRKGTEISINGTGVVASRRAGYVKDSDGNKKLGVDDSAVMHQKSYLVGPLRRRNSQRSGKPRIHSLFNKREPRQDHLRSRRLDSALQL